MREGIWASKPARVGGAGRFATGEPGMGPVHPSTLHWKIPGLKEKRRDIFYKGQSAFLHFHESHKGRFADLRRAGDWRWYPVNNRTECAKLLKAATAAARTR